MHSTPAGGEFHAFVIWSTARFAQDMILDEVGQHGDVVAAFEADWPAGVSAEEGYARFYGPLLPDAVGKAKRAGTGPFFVILVKLRQQRYGWRMTQRGLEYVNLEMFEMKWRFREFTGGLHTVHGTASPEESRRDVMLLTGHTPEEWLSGAVTPADVSVLPGRGGWRDMAEMLRFANAVIPYAVMRNSDELPDRLDPVHGDVDILTVSARWCAVLLNAEKVPRASSASYSVKVGGMSVRLDIREIGDGYYDENWERALLSGRVMNARGFYEFAPRDGFFALVYHILFTKRSVAPDYHVKLLALARKAGVGGESLDEWWRELESYMAERGYSAAVPVDRSLRPVWHRIEWRRYAMEAQELFGIDDPRPTISASDRLVMKARMDGSPVCVVYFPGSWKCVLNAYEMHIAFQKAAPDSSPRPLRCHSGRTGGYAVLAMPAGRSVASWIADGRRPSAAALDRMAEEAVRLANALDASGIVHRNINEDDLLVSEDGALELLGFDAAVHRCAYKCETRFLRKKIAARLAQVGGAGVYPPAPDRKSGWWNDRRAIARALAPFAADSASLRAALGTLEAEARAGKGALNLCLRKMTVRLVALWIEFFLRGLVSPRRRKSEKFRRIAAFVRVALWK